MRKYTTLVTVAGVMVAEVYATEAEAHACGERLGWVGYAVEETETDEDLTAPVWCGDCQHHAHPDCGRYAAVAALAELRTERHTLYCGPRGDDLRRCPWYERGAP